MELTHSFHRVSGGCYGARARVAGFVQKFSFRSAKGKHMTRPGNEMPDNVNHPNHYTAHPSGVECITIVEHCNFNVGSAIKYLLRAGLKNNYLEDLRKAAWYINREIERTTKGA